MKGLRSVGGAVLAAIGFLSQPDVLAVLPETPAKIVMALGAVLSVIGLRFAKKSS